MCSAAASSSEVSPGGKAGPRKFAIRDASPRRRLAPAVHAVFADAFVHRDPLSQCSFGLFS